MSYGSPSLGGLFLAHPVTEGGAVTRRGAFPPCCLVRPVNELLCRMAMLHLLVYL
jgi:hypothetical protein